MYLYGKDLYEPKYQPLIKDTGKILQRYRKDTGIKHLNDPKAFIEYSNAMDDVYDNIDNYNPERNRKILIAFVGMIADMNTNIKFKFIVNLLFAKTHFFLQKKYKAFFKSLTDQIVCKNKIFKNFHYLGIF